MQIRPENTTRKIDHLGRVTIPKSLRDRLRIETNDELELFMIETPGRTYIGLSPLLDEDYDPRYAVAAKVLDELGFNVPEILAEKAGIKDAVDLQG